MVLMAKVTGQEPPKFEDHTPYSNRGKEDLLKLNDLVSATKTEIIPPQSNKTIKAHTPLISFDENKHEHDDRATSSR